MSPRIHIPTRIVKVGGSLLDCPDLPRRLGAWLNDEPSSWNLVVVGGGALVDRIRTYDREWGLGEVTSHWLAIRGMGLNAAALTAAMGWDSCLRTAEEIETWRRSLRFGNPNIKTSRCVVVDDLLRDDAQPPSENWRYTSDSLSAWLAHRIGADELVLLKSTTPDVAQDPKTFVDSAFSEVAIGIPRVIAVNLRDDKALRYWLSAGVCGIWTPAP